MSIRICIADPAEYADPARTPESVRAAAAEHNAAIFTAPQRCLGVEVLHPQLVDRCGLGNIDPQHGRHAPYVYGDSWQGAPEWPEPRPGEAACSYAVRLVEARAALPAHASWVCDEEWTIVLERAGTRSGDLDGWAAAAVLVMGSRWLHEVQEVERRNAGARNDAVFAGREPPTRETLPEFLTPVAFGRIVEVATADSFRSAPEWEPSLLPTADSPWPRGAESTIDSRRRLAAINALVLDGSIDPDRRLQAVASWIERDEAPEAAFAARGRLLDAIELGHPGCDLSSEDRAQLDIYDARQRVEDARMQLVEQLAQPGALRTRDADPAEATMQNGPVRPLCIVKVDHPGAIAAGYAEAPVVCVIHPRTGKVTIAAWPAGAEDAYLDARGLADDLNALEAVARGIAAMPARTGWGGPPRMCASPIADGTRLDEETILHAVHARMK